jgi:hypothetical protein
VQEPEGDDMDLGATFGSGTEKRHAALKRMRERRSERAREAAHERDEALHGLLAEQDEDGEERSHHHFTPARADRSIHMDTFATPELTDIQERSTHMDRTAELEAMEAQHAEPLRAHWKCGEPAVQVL